MEKALISFFKGIIDKCKRHLRAKEQLQKEYYLPYYNEVETILSQHITVISWLNEIVTSYSYTTDDDMHLLMEEVRAHNLEVTNAAEQAAQGKSIKSMAREIDNLVIRLNGTIDPSLITSLQQYAKDLYDADEINEFHFLQDPCQNSLNLTRDLKARIPSIHSNSNIQ
ncbi:hypothetical protein GBN32_17430 [Plesiomonas shigelloides]|uniref:hypothetical protein n=1 Tax=Plesiomonas shigelloides TaxID=703 RepID=UPI001262A6B0|nr:hypothetical protein [Plesiomonas shigelloides]KAB7704653.1 hypothetical protein GBN32_17430 [Plesiomonas shigelloides]